MISNKDLRVEDGNIIINGEKHPLDPAVNALTKRANIVQGKFSALDTRLDAIEALEKTASGNPISLTGAAEAYAMGLSMAIEPIQDLHGYSKPWPAGGGKNLLPMTVAGIKALNNTQWSRNTTTVNGVTITILTNDGNNVTGVNFNGTATANLSFTFSQLIKGYGDTLLNSGVNFSGGDLTLWMAGWYQGGSAFYGRFFQKTDGSDAAVDIDSVVDNCYVGVGIVSGYTIDLTFKPMMRLATETDPTFEPYSNICPISGPTSGVVETTDGTDTNTATITFGQTVYGGSVNFKTGEVTVTHANIESYNGEPINEPWLSSIDKYVSGATPTTGAQVVYPLTTPTTLTLTPAELELLKGNNTVSGNGVTINIDYIGR